MTSLLSTAKARSVRLLGGQFEADQLKRLPRRALSRTRPLPDFLVIGAQKSGSTTLYDYLVQHPDIRSALTKEVHFFDSNHHRGENWYRSNFPLAVPGRPRTWLTGEATPYYLLHPLAPARAAALVPEAKLLVTLRHPVDRAYSHYQHERAKGTEGLPFGEALAREAERIAGPWARLCRGECRLAPEVQSYSYLARSRYDEQIARWLEHYPVDRLLAVAAEELFAEPATVMRRVFTFLGLDPDVPLDYRRLNARSYTELDPALRRELNASLRGSVRRLEALLGRGFTWNL